MLEHLENAERRRMINWFLGTSAGALGVSIVYPVLLDERHPFRRRAPWDAGHA